MVDYREDYGARPTVPYDDVGNNSYVGPLIALVVVALFIGGIFFFSTAPQNSGAVSGESAPAAIDAPAEPAAAQPAAAE